MRSSNSLSDSFPFVSPNPSDGPEVSPAGGDGGNLDFSFSDSFATESSAQ
jgi:hypothetical protein